MTGAGEQPPPAPKPGQPVGATPPQAKPPAKPEPKADPLKTDPAAAQDPPRPADIPEAPIPPGAATPHSTASGNGSGPGKSVGELFLEVSEQATILVREEIELAKTEVTEKVSRLLRGSVVGLVAGVFLLLALFLAMHGLAIYLGDNVFGHRAWVGYLVESAAFILIAAAGGFYAYRAVKKGSPPVPEMAIEQAKEIRESLAETDA
jgi:uncharacterized membrane protein YqjE